MIIYTSSRDTATKRKRRLTAPLTEHSDYLWTDRRREAPCEESTGCKRLGRCSVNAVITVEMIRTAYLEYTSTNINLASFRQIKEQHKTQDESTKTTRHEHRLHRKRRRTRLVQHTVNNCEH